MLTGKQKQYLKSTAVDFSAVVQIGKEGITDNVINSVTEALAARELIKVKINQKDCSVTFYPNKDVDAMEDLYTILHDFGFTDQGYWE